MEGATMRQRLHYYLVFCLGFLLLSFPLRAQTPFLVKEINRTLVVNSSSPAKITNVNGTVYFSAFSIYGLELWKRSEEHTSELQSPY